MQGGLRAARAGVAGPLPGARGACAARSSASARARSRAASPTSGPATSTSCCRSSCACSPRARRSRHAGAGRPPAARGGPREPEGAPRRGRRPRGRRSRRSLKATLEIQEKRLANLDTAANNLAVVDAELERIEQQVRLVREESAVSRSPEALSARLDAVSRTLGETSRFLDQHAEIFSDASMHRLRDRLRAPAAARARRAEEEARLRRPAAPARGPEAEMTRVIPRGSDGWPVIPRDAAGCRPRLDGSRLVSAPVAADSSRPSRAPRMPQAASR